MGCEKKEVILGTLKLNCLDGEFLQRDFIINLIEK